MAMINFKLITVVFAVANLVGGCSLFNAAQIAATPVPTATITQLRNDTLAAKTGYQALLTVAVAYNKLPRCGNPSSPPICSTQSVVVMLRNADATAENALNAAENIVREATPDMTIASATVLAAQNAVAAFKTIQTQNSITGSN